MAWETPKTNWNGVGDRFNATDYNRIKNNIAYLRELAVKLYEDFTISSLSDKSVSDFFYADEINQIEENLNAINDNTLKRSYGVTPVYQDNGHTMDYIELNRIESATLDLYDRLTNELNGLRTFTWNFGMKGGDF